jgi:hypothetical protein
MNRTKVATLLIVVLALVAVGHHQLARMMSNQALSTNLIPLAYAQATPTPTPTPTPAPTPTPTPTPPPPILGRMTGGGSLFFTPDGALLAPVSTEVRVTQGFQIHCGTPPEAPNSLEVNWPGNQFHLENLTLGVCILLGPPNPPVAPFNEFIGAGTGRLNGTDGASISFIFIDNGEPGTSDTGTITITDPFGSVVLFVPTTLLHFGNFQAHACTPSCN